MRPLLLALLALALVAPSLSGQSAQRYREQIAAQLLVAGLVYTAGGYELTHEVAVETLDDGYFRAHSFYLTRGVRYAMVGVCDEDCTDLDFRLRDGNGNVVDADFLADDTPIVEVTPRTSGWFRVEAHMATCYNEPCWYGVAVFGR